MITFYSLWGLFVVVSLVLVDLVLGWVFCGGFLRYFLSFLIGLYFMNFPPQDCLHCVPKVLGFYVFFFLFSRNFLISSSISLLTHSLFNNLLFRFPDFEWFWVFSLRLVSSFNLLWFEIMHEMIAIFLSLLRIFLTYHVVYIWKYSLCNWKECIFCFFGVKGSVYIN